MKQTDSPNNPKEFYQHSDSYEVNLCNHSFRRISTSRIQCHKCGLGFFDNPFDPFPVEEVNKAVKKEVEINKKIKDKKDVEKNV